jgi:ADP-ribose pyrophosphatase YjhB (NUDIX family)
MIRHAGFRFCPRCGGTRIDDDEGKAIRCGDCGFLYFHNTASAVAVLLETDRGLLLARRNAEPGNGLLDLPGGFVDYGESCESALRREVKEEMDLDLGELTYFGSFPNIYEYHDVTYFTTDMVFRAAVPEGFKPKLNAEIRELALVRRESLAFHQLAFEVTKLVLKEYWKITAV